MGHAVQPEPDLLGGVAAQHPEAVVRVGDLEARGRAGEPHRGLEDKPTRTGDAVGGAEEAGAEHDLDVVAPGQLDHGGGVVDVVLAVGVEGDDVVHVETGQRVPDAGLERRTLAQVGGVADDIAPAAAGQGRAVVAAAVVDADHVRESAACVGDHAVMTVASLCIGMTTAASGTRSDRSRSTRRNRRDPVALGCGGGPT